MAFTAQEYIDRMAQTRSAHLKNLDTTGKRIQGIYAKAAKDLAQRVAAAKDKSLTKRWQEDYQKALERRVEQMRKELGSTILSGMKKSAGLPGETTEAWLNDALAMAGVDGSFTGVFSGTPDDVLRALLDGRMYRDGKSLSRRIWNRTEQLQGSIEEIVAQGIAQKRSALNIARDLEAYVNPKAKMPVSWLKIYPSIPFDRQIDYNAQRLARTAINHAYWAANVETALQNPFCTAIHWQLAPWMISILYLEGRTDEKYFRKAVQVYGISVPFRFQWVGHLDDRGQEVNTGEKSIDAAYQFLIGRNLSVRNICLKDCDTNAKTKKKNNVVLLSMPSYENSKGMKKGIENALVLDQIDLAPYYSSKTTKGDYGEEKQIQTFDKMACCDAICALDDSILREVFSNLKTMIDRLVAVYNEE